MKRRFKHLIILVIAFGAYSISGYAQDTTSVQATPMSYFKVEIGIIVDCPVLPVRLHDQLIGLKGIKDYKKDKKAQSIFFTVPEGVTTKEQVMSIAVACGFPAHLVNVRIDNKPFTN